MALWELARQFASGSDSNDNVSLACEQFDSLINHKTAHGSACWDSGLSENSRALRCPVDVVVVDRPGDFDGKSQRCARAGLVTANENDVQAP
jgi:hypothetical protein